MQPADRKSERNRFFNELTEKLLRHIDILYNSTSTHARGSCTVAYFSIGVFRRVPTPRKCLKKVRKMREEGAAIKIASPPRRNCALKSETLQRINADL